MPQPYTEDQFVDQPAIGLFAELGFQQLQNHCRTRDLLLPRLLSGQVELAMVESFHPNHAFHQPVKHGK